MIQTFNEWMTINCSPPENYSFSQYGNYLEGWRQSMPWAYSGMSIAYDNLAEDKWMKLQCKEALMRAWRNGLSLSAKSLLDKLTPWAHKATPEECADFMLYFLEGVA